MACLRIDWGGEIFKHEVTCYLVSRANNHVIVAFTLNEFLVEGSVQKNINSFAFELSEGNIVGFGGESWKQSFGASYKTQLLPWRFADVWKFSSNFDTHNAGTHDENCLGFFSFFNLFS